MKAISLWQPWAEAIAVGLKTIETRGWKTHYRGELAIHASQQHTGALRQIYQALLDHDEIAATFGDLDYDSLTFGAVVATARLDKCVAVEEISPVRLTTTEKLLGDYSAGRFGWFLSDVKPLARPIVCRGGQRLFNVSLS